MSELVQLRPNKRQDAALSASARRPEQLSLIGFTADGMLRMGCLGELGHQVIGVGGGENGAVDLDAWVRTGEEPYLNNMLGNAADAGLLKIGFGVAAAVARSDATLLCVDVPVDGQGACDLTELEGVVEALGAAIAAEDDFHTVIVCSAVPPGTTLGYIAPTLERACQGTLGEDFGVAVWPLVLREGQAVDDFFTQQRMVVAASDLRALQTLQSLMEDTGCELVTASFAAAELHSFAVRAWRGLQLSFETELGQLCSALEIADVSAVLPHDVARAGPDDGILPPISTRTAANRWMQMMDAVRALGFFAESLCLSAPTIAGLEDDEALLPAGLYQPRSRYDLH